MVMTIIGPRLTSLVIAREWERGTMEAMANLLPALGEGLWIPAATRNQFVARRWLRSEPRSG